MIALHERSRRPLWLASLDHEPAGLLSFIGFADRVGWYATAELAIHVRKRHRHCGVGRELIQRAKACAQSLGFDRYVAYIRQDNVASLNLFQRSGFDHWGKLPGTVQGYGRRHDVALLGLEL
jgi:phosphinothricin acetyltransferase